MDNLTGLTLLIIGYRIDLPTLNLRSAIPTNIESSLASNLVPLRKDSRIIIRHTSPVVAVDWIGAGSCVGIVSHGAELRVQNSGPIGHELGEEGEVAPVNELAPARERLHVALRARE